MFDTAFFNGRSVLVTGASGFIGSHLCKRLIQLGAVVHGVSRIERKGGGVSRWWQAELNDELATSRVINSVAPDIIYHLASFVSGKREIEFVLPALRSNLLSTVNLLVGATQAECPKVVLTGSLEEAEGDVATAIPASPYAVAKTAASSYARMFHTLYATPVVTARLFMVYGPAQKDRTKLVPYVTLSLLRGESPKLMSGRREVDWIYVDDVVDAYLALATTPGIHGQTVDVGSGVLASVRQVVEQLADIIAAPVHPDFGSVVDRPMERLRVADVNRTFELMGWKPKTSLIRGLEQTVNWYRDDIRQQRPD